MSYGLLSDIVLILHAGFVAFVVLGALLMLHWPRTAWIHVPVVCRYSFGAMRSSAPRSSGFGAREQGRHRVV